MPQLALLLSLLLFVSCDTLVKISTLPISDTSMLLFTGRALWYRTNTNQISRLTRAGATTINIPEPLWTHKLRFVEAPNYDALIFSETFDAFYLANQTSTQEFHSSLDIDANIFDLYYTVSNSYTYVIALFSTSTFSYSATCTCLETGAVNMVATDVVSVSAHKTGVFLVSRLVNDVGELLLYDPHSNTTVMIDNWSHANSVTPRKIYSSIIYWSTTNSAKQYYIDTNTTSALKFNSSSQFVNVIEAPTSSHIQQFLILTYSGTSYLCNEDIISCSEFKIEMAPSYWAFVPMSNKLIFIPISFPSTILSYSLYTHQSESVLRKVDWKKSNENAMILLSALIYDEESESILFTSIELLSNEPTVVALHRLNMKTGQTSEVTTITTQAKETGAFVYTKGGPIIVIKEEEGEYWLFELLIEEAPTRAPIVIRKHDVVGFIAFISTLPAVIAVFFVIFFVCLYRCQKNLSQRGHAPQPYELVEN